MIDAIVAILSFFISPWGLAAMMFGFLVFLSLPIIGQATNLPQPAQFLLWLARLPLKRAAIVVGEHGDLYFKSMSFDSLGVEVIELDGEEKLFEDPDEALHYWMGIPFAFADEVHGVLFDPRHAAVGDRKHTLDERDEGEYLASNSEWEHFGVSKWKPAVFGMPEKHELVNLSRVRQLVDGGERSEYAKRVEELYKHSRAPFDSGTPMTHFFYPIVGFLLTFGGLWLMGSQLGGGDMPDTGVSFGASVIALLATNAGMDLRRYALTVGAIIATTVPIVLLALVSGPVLAIAFVFAVGIGFAIIPVITLLSQPISIIGGWLSKMYFRAAFMSFRKPVLEWTPESYELIEFDDLDTNGDVKWYTLFGSRFGVTYKPGEESWGADTVTRNELESRQPVTDGGSSLESNLPSKYVPTDLSRDSYGGYIPSRLERDKYYLNSAIATARFKNSAVGEKSLKRLLEAKEKHGETGNGVSDKTVLYLTAASGFVGMVLGVLFFVL